MADRDDDSIALIPTGLLMPTALRQPAPPPKPMPDAVDLSLEGDGIDGVRIDPKTGAILIENEDGSIEIDLNPRPPGAPDRDHEDFDANLAEFIDSGELGRIADDLLRSIQSDEQSRREWLETRAQGIRILGLSIDTPRSSVDTTTALEGMSNIRHPLLLEATLRFQANARGELLPASGPVKVVDKLTQTQTQDELSEKLEDDFNYYLTEVATEYYPDTDRMLLYVGFGGSGFKKVYNCPLRRRPVSESVDAKDLIVSDAATDLQNAGRITHQIKMRQSVLKRMQLVGAYRNVPLSTPVGVIPNAVDRQIAETQGIELNQQQITEDRDHTIYETYCELNIRDYEHRDDKGEITGLPLPYRVVIDKDSRQILEVRRNWREDDPTLTAKICFVKYSYVPGLGFYDIGLIHILGNTANSLTAAWRELLDAGMFANFPGFLYAKSFGRQNTNEFRVPPGGGAPIDTNGMAISEAVMPLPYKDVSSAFAQFVEHIAETGARVGGTSEVQVAEGRQDAPVGTTLAMIEQATKIEGAVHKRLHAAQALEFQLLKDCFRENPDAFLRALKARGETQWDEQSFMAALNDSSIVPVADPNTPSHMHRLMKAMGLVQLDKAYPGVMDGPKLVKRVASMMGVSDFDALLAAPQAQNIPPEMLLRMKELEDRAQDRQAKMQLQQLKDQSDLRQFTHEERMQQRESWDQVQDRQSRLKIAQIGFEESLADNRAQIASEQLKTGVARLDAMASLRTSADAVKVAEHGVKVAEHKAKADTEKAKASARRPTPSRRDK